MSRVPYASAMYAMVYTRPDLAHAVSVVSRFMGESGKEHWQAVKRIFCYLRGTSDVGFIYGGDTDETPFCPIFRPYLTPFLPHFHVRSYQDMVKLVSFSILFIYIASFCIFRDCVEEMEI